MHGEHWRPRPMIDGDLANFRNNGLSRGFDDVLDRRPSAPVRKVSDDFLTAFYAIHRSFIDASFFQKYYCNGVGNPEGPTIDGYLLTLSDLHAIYNAWTLWRTIAPPKRIVEIGPGFGALAAILRQVYPDTELILIDLPEHQKVLTYYLEQTVGTDNITITSDIPESADVVIALRCFMEMPMDEVCRYLEWIQSSGVHWFYLINRYIKKNVLKEYPFDDRWLPFVSRNDFSTGQIHEFLLARTEDDAGMLRKQLDILPPFYFARGDEEMMVTFKGQLTGNRLQANA